MISSGRWNEAAGAIEHHCAVTRQRSPRIQRTVGTAYGIDRVGARYRVVETIFVGQRCVGHLRGGQQWDDPKVLKQEF